MQEAVIVDAVRTPVGKGKPGGMLSSCHPVELVAHVLRALVDRTGIDHGIVEDVIVGCVNQVHEQSTNVGRNAVLSAGFPEHVPATMVERQCGSSQQAATFAAQAIIAGSHDVIIAAGVEMMSKIPMRTARGSADPFGPLIPVRYPDGFVNQGISAELIAARWELSRHDQDAFALRSQQLAARARDGGLFDDEIVPLAAHHEGGPAASRDEGIRETSLDGLAALKPVFRDEMMAERFPQIEWSVTAGNSSQISDGASAMLVMSRSKAEELGLRPRVAFRSFAVIGDDPLYKLTGVIPATKIALERSGLSIGDIDLFEVNEAFASVVLAWGKELKADMERVNINGGAIALGHPLGASGARLMTTLVHSLERTGGRYGMQAMCEGGGMANVTIVERLGS